MKKTFKTIQKIMLSIGLLTLTATAIAPKVQAIDPGVVDEAWGKPTFVHGGGLNDDQIKKTADLLGIDDLEDVVSISATGQDLVDYLGYGSGNTASMISSVLVQKGRKDGVNLEIVTPNDITLITEQQYINAAITAGVENVSIEVASIRPVTGESALTGVYKALEANGEELDTERMEVAQDELETTSKIADTEDLDEEDSGKLDGAIIEIKQQLAELKERTDELATREEIEEIINDALKKYDLQDVISVNNINNLIVYFEKYQQTSAIDSEEVKKQLNEFANQLGDRLGGVWEQAEENGLIDRVVNFFKDIIDSITNLFKKD